jgi:hypothetical protein
VIRKTTIVSAATAAALAGAGLIAVGTTASGAAPHGAPAVAAHHHHHFTKEHFTALTVSTKHLDKYDVVTSVTLRSRHLSQRSKTEGAVEFTCHRASATATSEHCKGAFALLGGMIYVNANLPFTTYNLKGKITGGSGVYKGASGKISAIGDGPKHSLLTLRYKT